MANDFLVTNTKGRAPAELIGTSEKDLLGSARGWQVIAPVPHAPATVQTALGAAFGSTLVELDPGYRAVEDTRGAHRVRVQGTVRNADSAPAEMALVPLVTDDPPDTPSPAWRPADGGTAAAGGPAFGLGAAGFQITKARVVDPTARRRDVLCSVGVRGGNGSARPVLGALRVEWMAGPPTATTYCEGIAGAVWCDDYRAYADTDALDAEIGDAEGLYAADAAYTSAAHRVIGTDGDAGYLRIYDERDPPVSSPRGGSVTTAPLNVPIDGAEVHMRYRLPTSLDLTRWWAPTQRLAVLWLTDAATPDEPLQPVTIAMYGDYPGGDYSLASPPPVTTYLEVFTPGGGYHDVAVPFPEYAVAPTDDAWRDLVIACALSGSTLTLTITRDGVTLGVFALTVDYDRLWAVQWTGHNIGQSNGAAEPVRHGLDLLHAHVVASEAP